MTDATTTDPEGADPDEGRWTALLAVDLDGTLLDDESKLPERARAALEWCGENKVLRVAATGRNLLSAKKALDDDFPVDRLVASTGIGTYEWPGAALVHAEHLDQATASDAVAVLRAAGLDFMLHLGVPDNHFFYYFRTSYENADFERRLKIYDGFAAPLPPHLSATRKYSQLVAIGQPGIPAGRRLAELRTALPGCELIRSTSPLDHVSPWFEVYPKAVNKASGLERLRREYRIPDANVVAIGNDYNDEHMLNWATQAFVVANAAPELRAVYPTVASNEEGGVADVVSEVFGWPG